PWAEEIGCDKEMQVDGLPRRCGGDQPPASLRLPYRRIGPLAFEDRGNRPPVRRKAVGTIEANRARLVALRHEIALAAVFEHERIRQMKGLAQDETVIPPLP